MRPLNDYNLLFLLGKDQRKGVFSDDIKMESAINQDIIIGDFVG